MNLNKVKNSMFESKQKAKYLINKLKLLQDKRAGKPLMRLLGWTKTERSRVSVSIVILV